MAETELKQQTAPVLEFGADVAGAPVMPTVQDGQVVPNVMTAVPSAQELPTISIEQHMEENINLSPEEKQQIDEFAGQIDITNSAAIINYGVGTQKKLADFSQKTLESVRAKDMGEVGEMVTGLVVQLKNFDVDDEDQGFLSKLFKKGGNKIDSLKSKYSKVETNVTTITNELEKHQIMLLKDVDVLDKMYDMNLVYFKELTMYVLAGKKKLESVRANELIEAQNKAKASGLAEDVQKAKDLADQCDRFEKKLHDLELTRTVALQTGPQIRLMQSSDTAMAEKIQSTIVNTIPLWKNQMVIALGIEHSAQAARAQREVSDMTNELLKKNADKLKVATVENAKEAERGIVDVETLKHTNEQLISTLDEVMKIQQEGKEKRKLAEAELIQIEDQLKVKLLEASNR